MKNLKEHKQKILKALKVTVLVIVAIILLFIALQFLKPLFNSVTNRGYYYGEKMMANSIGSTSVMDSLSIRNLLPQQDTYSEGSDAEEFEVTEYSASIETRRIKDTCSDVEDLKIRKDVIFESSNKQDDRCNYYFKVERKSVEEVLSVIKGLNPKKLNENTHTIKSLVDDYTSEIEILENKMKTIEETLNNAIIAYDSITDLATRVEDVESLAKIITSKINIIERLTEEKIQVSSQLDRINRSKAEQIDRVNYTYFSVHVYENKFINGDDLVDSWKSTIRSFITDTNNTIQNITIGLIRLIIVLIQYLIYLFMIFIVAKYAWKFAQDIWKK